MKFNESFNRNTSGPILQSLTVHRYLVFSFTCLAQAKKYMHKSKVFYSDKVDRERYNLVLTTALSPKGNISLRTSPGNVFLDGCVI